MLYSNSLHTQHIHGELKILATRFLINPPANTNIICLLIEADKIRDGVRMWSIYVNDYLLGRDGVLYKKLPPHEMTSNFYYLTKFSCTTSAYDFLLDALNDLELNNCGEKRSFPIREYDFENDEPKRML